MAIVEYTDMTTGITVCKDTNVLGSNCYAEWPEGGQGCGTIWFATVGQARAVALQLRRMPTGREAGLCDQCRGTHRHGSAGWKKYPDWACKEWKERIASGDLSGLGLGSSGPIA